MPSWFTAYVALAVLNLLALSTSLALNYRQANLFESSIDNYRFYADLLERVNMVARNGIAVSAATSSVFTSRDVKSETARLVAATAEFRTAFAHLSESVAELPTPERDKLVAGLEGIEIEFKAVVDEGEQTLIAFGAGQMSAAGQHAAAKVTHFNRLAARVLGISQIVRNKQLVILGEQSERGKVANRFGGWLVLISAVVAVAVFWHARFVRRAMRVQKLQRDRLLRATTRARDAAEYAARAKAQFLANMSHEIRTPMNGVLGMLDALGSTRLTLEQAKLLRVANTSADLLLSIIDDVLDFSKIDAGMLLIESTPFDLHEVANHVESLYGARAAEKLLTLRCELPENPLPLVMGDTTRLTQLLSNLISNAIKFTVAGEVVIKIQLVSEDEGSARVRFIVRDSGIGLSADEKSKLFAPFTQADTSTSRRYGGTGLGLAICKQLVMLLDKESGEIGVDSTPGGGSTFFFVLRLKKAPSHGGREDLARYAPATVSHFSGRVLVAEDNEINQQVATTMLKNLGLESVVAGNGRDAIDAVRTERFDLILMDYHMPELDGCDATLEIRRFEEESGAARTPIVAVTASVLKEDKERCLASGMDDFLAKPIRQQSVAAMLKKWLPQNAHSEPAVPHKPSADETLLRSWSSLPSEYFDLEQLLEMRSIAGDSFNNLVEQFHGSAQEGMSVLQRAIDGGDASTLRRAAHKLKGAAASLGAKTLAEECYALELIGKENQIGAAQERLAALEKEYLRVRRYMDACAEDAVPPAA